MQIKLLVEMTEKIEFFSRELFLFEAILLNFVRLGELSQKKKKLNLLID